MGFEPANFTEFRYTGFTRESTADGTVAAFSFALVGETTETFTERVRFETADVAADEARLDRVLALLGAILGLSYYKAAAPARFVVDGALLTAGAVEYLRRVLREGLAEFAYRNELPGFLEPTIAATTVDALPVVRVSGTPLVPIGGGKDSVVSVESLAVSGFTPVQFAVNPNVIITRVAAVSGYPLIGASRRIDARLLQLNAEGALNGHVPVTAMNSLIAVAQSLLLGLGPVVMSNESSASDPTLEWNGQPVNHQWSKSLEAEVALREVLADQAGLENAYFSLLRPFSELRIARGFAQTTKYDTAIVSCNRAFRMGADHVGWCGDCDKCRFVFLAMAPYMSRDRLTAIFGKNMFEDPAQLPGYRALLGLDAHKPFECVGEEAECSVAMSLAAREPDWGQSVVISQLQREIPGLSEGSTALERVVFSEADAVDAGEFESARHALV
ncbi:UDP-N-acetyl-alpha-D-muramoyl-L-alanyl-L-glutamate epimerase [soil metagenome]